MVQQEMGGQRWPVGVVFLLRFRKQPNHFEAGLADLQCEMIAGDVRRGTDQDLLLFSPVQLAEMIHDRGRCRGFARARWTFKR